MAAPWQDASVTEFRHEIPMRWADLDSLNHVNNVVYLRYAADARAVIDSLPAGRIETMEVQFKRPILLGTASVVVTTQIDRSQVTQSIGVEGSPHEFASVTSVFGGHAPAVPAHEGGYEAELRLRRTDLDASGQVSAAQAFELFQETRIPYFRTVMPWMTPGGFVVAQLQVRYHQPITWRSEPLVARAWMSRVGNASFAAESQLVEGDQVLASSSSILVGFDATTQTSRPFTDIERESLASQLG